MDKTVERYIESLGQRLEEIDAEIKKLQIRRSEVSDLIERVRCVEGVIPTEDIPISPSPSPRSTPTSPVKRSTPRQQTKKDKGVLKEKTARECILEVMRMANGVVLSSTDIRKRVNEEFPYVKNGAIYQAKSDLLRRGIICQEPGGFVIKKKDPSPPQSVGESVWDGREGLTSVTDQRKE